MLDMQGDGSRELGHQRLVFPPSARLSPRPSCSVQRGHTQAAPQINQMRQVQLRWSPVIQPAWVCSPHYRAAYLMSVKEKKGKDTSHSNSCKKLGCVEMIIMGCLTLSPPRPRPFHEYTKAPLSYLTLTIFSTYHLFHRLIFGWYKYPSRNY